MPFQMLATAWVGLGAGVLPRCRGRGEIGLLAVYAAVAAYVFGFLLNMWFWPFAAGVTDSADPGLQFVPGDAVVEAKFSNRRLRFLHQAFELPIRSGAAGQPYSCRAGCGDGSSARGEQCAPREIRRGS